MVIKECYVTTCISHLSIAYRYVYWNDTESLTLSNFAPQEKPLPVETLTENKNPLHHARDVSSVIIDDHAPDFGQLAQNGWWLVSKDFPHYSSTVRPVEPDSPSRFNRQRWFINWLWSDIHAFEIERLHVDDLSCHVAS